MDALRERGDHHDARRWPIRRVYDVSHPIEWGQAGPGRMTGVAAAVGTLLLTRNGVTNAGFVDPERYYDPNAFLEELEHCGSLSVTWTDYPTSVGRLERLDRARGH